jgi:glycosyltransferase involved in cell wall biosynthesis
VRDGEDGFLVELGDVGELAGALARLAEDPELRGRMGEGRSARVLPRYSVSGSFDDVDGSYRSLLAR